ncbi:D-alanyl-D-alanine carboxypeptidase family protein [Streptomyces coeruleorubidus]|uniref:D-alanyl-D-alanine carboxypeptidase family protein n=1 Tax=Streptomyces coeruleorubidus TaxID=116188 RepID=UPI003681D5B4
MPWPQEGQAAVKLPGTGTVSTYGKQKPVPTASVAKVMTAYVLLQERPLKKDGEGPMIEVDGKTVQEGRSKHESRVEGLTVGQKFSQQDMLKMLLIPSGNNIARLLARWVTESRTETAFVRKMNDAARKLGMKDTTYTDPSGLDAGTVSTAVDQLKLAEAVMKFDAFRAVVALPKADVDGLGEPLINNMDRLLMSDLSIRGIKTGSNTPAGGTLVWAAYKTVGHRTQLILGTMLDQHADGPDPNGATSLTLVQDNSKKIVQAVRDALTSATAVRKGQVVGHLDDGLGRHTSLVAAEDFTVVGVPGQLGRHEDHPVSYGAPALRESRYQGRGPDRGQWLGRGEGPADPAEQPVEAVFGGQADPVGLILTLSGILGGRAQVPRVRQDFDRGISCWSRKVWKGSRRSRRGEFRGR